MDNMCLLYCIAIEACSVICVAVSRWKRARLIDLLDEEPEISKIFAHQALGKLLDPTNSR